MELNFKQELTAVFGHPVAENPTRVLMNAAARGCTTIDGLGMLINQGRLGIRYWTGVDPDAAVMRSALETIFSQEG